MKIIGLALLFFLGSAFVIIGVGFIRKANSTEDWPMVEGIVQDKYVTKISRSGSTPSFKPFVIYRYVVDGREYSNDRLTIISQTHGNETDAEKRIASYHAGETTEVYYNSKNPQDSVLIPGRSKIAYLVILVGALLLIAAAFILLKRMKKRG